MYAIASELSTSPLDAKAPTDVADVVMILNFKDKESAVKAAQELCKTSASSYIIYLALGRVSSKAEVRYEEF
jgi:hypothetical protein